HSELPLAARPKQRRFHLRSEAPSLDLFPSTPFFEKSLHVPSCCAYVLSRSCMIRCPPSSAPPKSHAIVAAMAINSTHRLGNPAHQLRRGTCPLATRSRPPRFCVPCVLSRLLRFQRPLANPRKMLKNLKICHLR